jgi:hypothetical protein
MDVATTLASQLLGAKQRYEDTGGLSQILGYYRHGIFDNVTNNVIFKNTNLTTLSLPAEKYQLFVMRLNKVGDKVKAKPYYIGLLYKSREPYNGKYYLNFKINKGKEAKLTVGGNTPGASILLNGNFVLPIHNKNLIDSLNNSLGSISDTKMTQNSGVMLTVDNVNEI